MILTTTNGVENRKIVEYLGIVTGTYYGSSYSHRDVKISFKDIFKSSKYTEAYISGVENLKEKAFKNLKDNAEKLDANAIIGIKLDIEPLEHYGTLLISITGTAVKVR